MPHFSVCFVALVIQGAACAIVLYNKHRRKYVYIIRTVWKVCFLLSMVAVYRNDAMLYLDDAIIYVYDVIACYRSRYTYRYIILY